MQAGEIRARGLGRLFKIRLSQSRSLKETILRRELPRTRELWALRDVDLDIAPRPDLRDRRPERLRQVDLLKLIAGIFSPSTGQLAVAGRVGSLIEIGAGFHPEFTGVENVYLNAAIYGLKRSYVDEHLEEIIDFAELEQFKDVPVRTYSSGMYMRLGFSVAMHIQPDILLLDEVLAVGDEAFQQKCFGRIGDFKRAGGTIVFVSHDPSAVERLCDRAILLDGGRSSRKARRARSCARTTAALVDRPGRARPVAETEARPVAAACTRCGPSRATARRATASSRASRWRSRSGSTPSRSSTTRSVTVGIRDAGRPAGRLPDARRRAPSPGTARAAAAELPGAADAGGSLLRRRRPRRPATATPSSPCAERALELSVFGQRRGGIGADSPRRHVGVAGRRRHRRRVT